MAQHNTCDRCGNECQPVCKMYREVVIDWPDAPTAGEKEKVELEFSVAVRHRDGRQDLCNECYAHILHEVASMLDSDGAVKS